MSDRLFLCRVRALYPYASKDPSALTFDIDDFIDVLQKLDSGWWEGWCNGSRGWFPSNFVNMVEDYSKVNDSSAHVPGFMSAKSDRGSVQSSEPPATPKSRHGVMLRKNNEYRLSLPVSDPGAVVEPSVQVKEAEVDLPSPTDFDGLTGLTSLTGLADLPPNWTMQLTEDGSSYYYFNTKTGEMRSTHPTGYLDNDSDYGDELYAPKMDASFDSDRDEEDEEDSIEEEEDHAFDFHSVDSRPWEEPNISDGEFPEKITSVASSPWTMHETRKGKPYYHNTITKETTWETPDIGYQTPTRRKEKSHLDYWKRAVPYPSAEIDKREVLSWNKLAANITTMINALDLAAATKQSPVCFDHAAAVVNAVRAMLVASGTIDKESTYIQSHTLLRSHHRTMMAAMSKLALSAQLCHSSTDNVQHLLAEAKELHTTARNFVAVCQEISVPVEHMAPHLIPESETIKQRQANYMAEGRRYKYTLERDIVDNVDMYGMTLKESMKNFLQVITEQTLKNPRTSLAGLLFDQFRDLGSQNGQFQGVVDDTEFGTVKGSPLFAKTQSCKRDLTAALGRIFFQIQLLTDSRKPVGEIVTTIQDAGKEVAECVNCICEWVRELLVDWETRRASTKSIEEEDADEKSSFAGTGFSMDGENTPSSITELTEQTFDRKFLFSRRGSTKPNNEATAAATAAIIAATSANASEKSVISKATNEQPWFLDYDYNPEEIVFTTEGQVKGGTICALVERLTLHDFLDMNFINTFLLTYRSFCTSMDLLTMLEGRFNLVPPPSMTSEERETWEQKKLKLVRLRVCNVLKNWLELYYNEDDYAMLDNLMRFTQTSIRPTLNAPSEQIQRLIRQRMEAETSIGLKKMILMLPDAPMPILPRNKKKFRLLDIDALELARQLTIMDFKLYSSIQPVECLDKAWSRDTGDDGNCVSVNIRASIEYCNQVTSWVSDAILSQPETKKRGNLIKYWVLVAEKCRLLNNFNTCMAILSAFDNSSVGRLKRTWETVGTRTTQTLAHIRKLMGANRNFTEYRAIIHSVNPPCIPFLGIYLQDLTFIEDGNANFLKQAKDLINFAKRAKTAEVIREIQQYQSSLYQLKAVDELQAFIQANLQSSRDEEQLYHESLKLEPKEREDEKVTRLLQESGFL